MAVRRSMLEEAVTVIRGLWRGRRFTDRGEHVTVEDAQLFTLPPTPPRILIVAGGIRSAELAGRAADGLIAVVAQAAIVGGGATHRIRVVADAAMRGALNSDLRTPSDFEQVARMLSVDDGARAVVCGPDPERHVHAIRRYADAGFTHVSVHQVGTAQQGFLDFCAREVLPRLATWRADA